MNPSKEKPPSTNLSPESSQGPGTLAHKGQYYEIRIKGQLSEIWADWFEGLTSRCLDHGEMLLSGNIMDQSALMGILNKLVRLNLTLISVNEIKKYKENK